MVEVFRTNVTQNDHAQMIINEILKIFPDYLINFDLDDCDKILRVECLSHEVDSSSLIKILISFGFEGEILPDDLLKANVKRSWTLQISY